MMFCDNTLLKSVATCSTQALVRHGLGYTSPSEGVRLKAGSAMHEALAVYMEDMTAAGAEATKVRFATAYEAWADEHVRPAERPFEAAYTYANVAAVLVRWLEMHPGHALPWADTSHVETAFEVPLTDGVSLTGRFDALVRREGDLYVLDHKTTGGLDERFRRQFRMSSQLSGYVYAAEAVMGERVRGVIVNAIEIARLPTTPTRKCAKHGVLYSECGLEHARSEVLIVDRSPAQVEAWRQDAIRLAKQWRLLQDAWSPTTAPQEGTFTNACAWCDFQEWCAVGRPSESIEKLFVHQPWSPLL